MHTLQLEGHVHGRAALPTFWPSGALASHLVPSAFPTRNTSLDHWEKDTGLGFAYLDRFSMRSLPGENSDLQLKVRGKSLRLALPLTSLEMLPYSLRYCLIYDTYIKVD